MLDFHFLYLLSIGLHIWAFFLGLYTIHSGACSVFSKSDFCDIFGKCRKKRISELLYFATVLGTAMNMFLILSKVGYILLKGAEVSYMSNPLLLTVHLCGGAAFIMYHQITLEKTRDMVNEKVFR